VSSATGNNNNNNKIGTNFVPQDLKENLEQRWISIDESDLLCLGDNSLYFENLFYYY